ncbi:MAG TPA: hypothetical protein VKG80_11990 [Trebonia sp.]|nr:hypothetical protein [Trebonia sp.]
MVSTRTPDSSPPRKPSSAGWPAIGWETSVASGPQNRSRFLATSAAPRTTPRTGPSGPRSTSQQLAEAFAYLGLTVFTSYFLNYAATELDIPDAAP